MNESSLKDRYSTNEFDGFAILDIGEIQTNLTVNLLETFRRDPTFFAIGGFSTPYPPI